MLSINLLDSGESSYGQEPRNQFIGALSVPIIYDYLTLAYQTVAAEIIQMADAVPP